MNLSVLVGIDVCQVVSIVLYMKWLQYQSGHRFLAGSDLLSNNKLEPFSVSKDLKLDWYHNHETRLVPEPISLKSAL